MEEYDEQQGMSPEEIASQVAAALSSPNMSFFGGQITKSTDLTWEPDTVFHDLSLQSLVLDPSAKTACTVTVTVDDAEGASNSFVIAVLRPGQTDQHQVQLTFPGPVVFSLSEGKGPVHLIGNVVLDRNQAEGLYAELVEMDQFGDEEGDEDDEDDYEDDTGPTVEELDGEEEEEESDDDEDEEEAPKLVSDKPKGGASKAKRSKMIIDDEDDDDDDEELDLTMNGEDDADEEDEEDDDDEVGDLELEDDDEGESEDDDDDDEAPTSVKKPVTAGKSKPKAKAKAKSAPAVEEEAGDDKRMKAYLAQILKSPNKPKKEKKFKNYCRSTLKVDDDAVLGMLWTKYQASL